MGQEIKYFIRLVRETVNPGSVFSNLKTRSGVVIFILKLFSAMLLLSSCSNLKYLKEGERLYTGSSISIGSQYKIDNKREIRSELEDVIIPEPNSKILFWRPGLWFYNIFASSESRTGNWITNRLGEPPVLFDEANTERTLRLINNRLFNMGHFDPEVSYNIEKKSGRAAAIYHVRLKAPYKISNIPEVHNTTQIAGEINLSMDQSLLEEGEVYSLDKLKKERERIDRYLKEKGYYFFNPDYLLFRADSSGNNNEIELFLNIKPATPSFALNSYTIRNIRIEPGYSADKGKDTISAVEVEIRDGLFIRKEHQFIKPDILGGSVFLEKGREYSDTDHRKTLNHLMGLGVFKFINIRFERAQATDKNLLDARIILTPMKKKSISSELQWVSKSNSFTGPGLAASFSNRNFFGGAENFSTTLEGSFESLPGRQGVTSMEVAVSSELSFPRILVPWNQNINTSVSVPKTNMSLSLNYRNRTDAFSFFALRSQFGYFWNPSVNVQHKFSPFIFSAFSLGTVSDEFKRIFSGEALMRRGLFEQFVLGSEYSYIYNSGLAGLNKHAWYFNLNIDLSGNFAWLFSNYIGSGKRNESGEFTILNKSFSHFGKSDIDIRYYLNTGNRSRLATRLIAGIGVPYGNSGTLPFTKLFTIGGSNSIRAFHPRTLGPGVYNPPDTLVSTLNIYRSGEIKLELNIEYRFDLGNVFKAAVFADAGNIWNLKEKENAPGGGFRFSDFPEQIALGTGAGLRLDFAFFLLRLDLSFPLAVPGSGNGGRYFSPVRPFDSQWRKDNLILNFAIGYPF